jgi:hypothetical protein
MVEFGGGYVHRTPRKRVHQTHRRWGVVFEENQGIQPSLP